MPHRSEAAVISHELQTRVGDRDVNITLEADESMGPLTPSDQMAIEALVDVAIGRWNDIASQEGAS